MIAFLIFLSTLDYIPHQVILLPVILVLIKNRNKTIQFNKHQIYILLIITIITFLSFLNSLFHVFQLESYTNLFPYTSLMFASFILAYYLEKKDFEIFVTLILIESIIVIIEYILGINTIFYFSDKFERFKSFSFLYYTRPFGLSTNSSVIAEKIMLSILIINYLNLFKKKILFYVIFGIALTFTFPRTVLVALIVFFLIKKISTLEFSPSVKRKTLYITIAFLFVIIISVIVGYKKYTKKIEEQFTRGNKKIELAGRNIIWDKYFDFIDHNFWFGNYSQKYGIKYHHRAGLTHAHNSFIQVLANHGIFITVFFILLIIVGINKMNYIYILPLIVLSLAQYGIFWGISLNDIILLFFLQNRKNIVDC